MGLFYYHGLTLIPAWISNHMPNEVWDKITNPLLICYALLLVLNITKVNWLLWSTPQEICADGDRLWLCDLVSAYLTRIQVGHFTGACQWNNSVWYNGKWTTCIWAILVAHWKHFLFYFFSMSPEKRLIKMLLERYRYVGDQGRPVLDLSTAVPVKFGLGLIQMALDEKKEMLTLNTWTRYVSDQVCVP